MSRATAAPAAFDALPGWPAAGHAAAWKAMRRSAVHIVAFSAELRPARPAPSDLRHVCARIAAETEGDPDDDAAARRRFERLFRPRPLESAGFLTGYYEPVVAGSPVRTEAFTAPLIEQPEAWERLWPDGAPDRAALEAFALTPEARPVVWLRDWTEVFLVQVQGSARVRLPDGRECRLTYAGRNGLPYTSIGRRLIEDGHIAAADMSLASLKDWLRRHGQEMGQPGRTLMQENRSYIFFRLAPLPAGAPGPIGGQGLPLAAGLSIAVDRALWSYGLPFFIAADEALPGFAAMPFSGLFIAQDTGSAIVGAARADLFLGTGAVAGEAAGRIRHPARFTVLEPREP